MIKKPSEYEMIDTSSKRVLPIKLIIVCFFVAIIGSLSIYVVRSTINSSKNKTVVDFSSGNQSTTSVQESTLQQNHALLSNLRSSKTIVSNFAKPMTETVYFSFDDTKIMPAELSKLHSFSLNIKNKNGSVIIEGHTDDIGLEEYNQELSNSRAEVVAVQLKQLGMDNNYRVTIRGSGETQPVDKNSSQQGRAMNRRVVIYFQN